MSFVSDGLAKAEPYSITVTPLPYHTVKYETRRRGRGARGIGNRSPRPVRGLEHDDE